MGSTHNWPFVINLGNSIMGVAVLAMPFCFQQCGILLCMLVLLFCTWLTLTSCQLLMKAGVTSRRRSYEFLAYHTHGAPGKFISEVGMIGFQLGTLIAQIVVIGDLGPAILSKLFGFEVTSNLRTTLMILMCLVVGLPMALLKDLRAVSRVSAVCVTFYCIFILYVLSLSAPNIISGGWYDKVRFWRPEGLFQSLPILSFSFGCQTQLFLLYDALPEPSLKTMSGVVSSAVNLCAVAYLVVGFCGYIAFNSYDIPGDVIGIFPNTFFTDLMKLCFVFSIVITFPVIIFPMRASIYTLLFAKKSKAHDDVMDSDSYMPAKSFKVITVSIVLLSMVIGVLIPNVEFILGMNGAIMGTLICYIFPALFFLKVMGSKQEGKNIAQLVLVLGVTILLVSTFATLRSQDKGHTHIDGMIDLPPAALVTEKALPLDNEQLEKPLDVVPKNPKPDEGGDDEKDKDEDVEVQEDVRKEPPNPDPPDTYEKQPEGNIKEKSEVKNEEKEVEEKDADEDKKDTLERKRDVDNADSVADKVKEHEQDEKDKKQDELLAQLEKHRIEQEKLIAEQKELLKQFKDHHEKDLKEEQQQQEALNPAPAQPVQQVVQNQQQVGQQQQQDSNIQPAPAQPLGQQQINQQPAAPQQQQVLNDQQQQPNQQQQLLQQQQPQQQLQFAQQAQQQPLDQQQIQQQPDQQQQQFVQQNQPVPQEQLHPQQIALQQQQQQQPLNQGFAADSINNNANNPQAAQQQGQLQQQQLQQQPQGQQQEQFQQPLQPQAPQQQQPQQGQQQQQQQLPQNQQQQQQEQFVQQPPQENNQNLQQQQPVNNENPVNIESNNQGDSLIQQPAHQPAVDNGNRVRREVEGDEAKQAPPPVEGAEGMEVKIAENQAPEPPQIDETKNKEDDSEKKIPAEQAVEGNVKKEVKPNEGRKYLGAELLPEDSQKVDEKKNDIGKADRLLNVNDVKKSKGDEAKIVNDTQKPRANEEMRRRLKALASNENKIELELDKKPEIDSALHVETLMGGGARSLLEKIELDKES